MVSSTFALTSSAMDAAFAAAFADALATASCASWTLSVT
jgi:hypothetical protein